MLYAKQRRSKYQFIVFDPTIYQTPGQPLHHRYSFLRTTVKSFTQTILFSYIIENLHLILFPLSGAALVPKNVGARKKRQVSNSVASSKKLEPENLDAITCSYKIVLCQACKFYHSWRQLWSHYTVVLLLVTCQKGKLFFIMIFSVILDVLFTLGPFSCWKWNRNFVWEQQPEVYLQCV